MISGSPDPALGVLPLQVYVMTEPTLRASRLLGLLVPDVGTGGHFTLLLPLLASSATIEQQMHKG